MDHYSVYHRLLSPLGDKESKTEPEEDFHQESDVKRSLRLQSNWREVRVEVRILLNIKTAAVRQVLP